VVALEASVDHVGTERARRVQRAAGPEDTWFC
jgi:hypothetical protein